MLECEFYVLNGELICECHDVHNKEYVFRRKDAENHLKHMIDFAFEKMNILDGHVIFENDKIKMTIKNCDKILVAYPRVAFKIMGYKILKKLSKVVNVGKITILPIALIVGGIKLCDITSDNLIAAGLEGEKIEVSNEDKIEEKQIENIIDTAPVTENEIVHEDDTWKNIHEYVYHAYIDCYDNGKSSDVLLVREKFGDIIDELSKRYGISPNLITAIITQESHGIHENLMQVTFEENDNYIMKLYDFEKKKYVTVVLTDSKDEYPDVDIVISSKQMREDPYYGILAGIATYRTNFEYTKHNILSALGAQNHGYTNWKKVLKRTAEETGVSYEDILYDQGNSAFTSFEGIVDGDPYYVRNVSQYIYDADNGIYVLYLEDDEIIQVTVYVNKTLGIGNKK